MIIRYRRRDQSLIPGTSHLTLKSMFVDCTARHPAVSRTDMMLARESGKVFARVSRTPMCSLSQSSDLCLLTSNRKLCGSHWLSLRPSRRHCVLSTRLELCRFGRHWRRSCKDPRCSTFRRPSLRFFDLTRTSTSRKGPPNTPSSVHSTTSPQSVSHYGF